MATITAVPDLPQPRLEMSAINSVAWSPMATGDFGNAVCLARNADRSVQVTGTFAGSTVTLQGSLVPTPTVDADWADLRDGVGVTLSLTAPGLLEIMQLTTWVRPKVTGGAASALTVRLTSRQSSM
jgi:hypothetical protein